MIPLSSLHEALAPAEEALHQVAVTQRRLALLQQQQLDATRDLLRLREEQLKLRRQQLSALQALLSSFACVHGGPFSPSQERARNQATLLLEQCVLDVQLASQACASSLALDLEHAPRVSCLCAEADRRAQEVSVLARHLLLLLTTANAGPASTLGSLSAGATEQQLSQLCSFSVPTGSKLLLESCPICLDPFSVDEKLHALQASEYRHLLDFCEQEGRGDLVRSTVAAALPDS
ncbi:hypothetical protein COCOBI_08-2320 [Coccomyxa sp. Obi]|nr:hypothetical protein COCOBI_08-2320 [Coccomyxa sp. Obi]